MTVCIPGDNSWAAGKLSNRPPWPLEVTCVFKAAVAGGFCASPAQPCPTPELGSENERIFVFGKRAARAMRPGPESIVGDAPAAIWERIKIPAAIRKKRLTRQARPVLIFRVCFFAIPYPSRMDPILLKPGPLQAPHTRRRALLIIPADRRPGLATLASRYYSRR